MRKKNTKLKGAQGVGNILERIDETVGKVIGGVDAPIIASDGVWYVLDTVGNEISHVGIGAVHVSYFSNRNKQGKGI